MTKIFMNFNKSNAYFGFYRLTKGFVLIIMVIWKIFMGVI